MKTVLMLILAMFVMVGCCAAYQVEFYWSHPRHGSPVEKYDFFLSVEDTVNFAKVSETTEITHPDSLQTLIVDMPEDGQTYFARVRAYDLLGRESPFSPISAPYVDYGVPLWGDSPIIGWRKVRRP